MNDDLKAAIDHEIERSHQSGMALALANATKRVLSHVGGSGEAMTAMVERQLVREASRRCIPVMLGHSVTQPHESDSDAPF